MTKPLAEPGLRRITRGDVFQDRGPSSWPDSSWSLDPEDILASFPMTGKAMARVVALFRESCVERIGEMRESLKTQDGPRLARAAHALRGSLGMFATSAALELARDLETRGKTLDLSGAGVILARLEGAIASLRNTLDDLASDPG